MGNANLYYFEPPQKLTFWKNDFRYPGIECPAMMYWFDPGATVRLQIYGMAPKEERSAALNSMLDWNHTGDARTITGMEGQVIDLHTAPYSLYPVPWDASQQSPKWTYNQLSIPSINAQLGTYPQYLNGKWVEGPPRFSGEYDAMYETGPFPSLTKISEDVGRHSYNEFSMISAIQNAEYRDVRPQVLLTDRYVTGTGCIDLLDLPVSDDAICRVRTEVIVAPSDLVTYRSTPPEVFRVGFIAFGNL